MHRFNLVNEEARHRSRGLISHSEFGESGTSFESARPSCRNGVEKMAGSTGLEPATSGLTEQNPPCDAVVILDISRS